MTTSTRAARVEGAATPPLLELTIGDQLRQQAQRFPDRPALVWARAGDPEALEELTYRELLHAAEAVAATLEVVAAPGDRIAVWAANSPEWVLLEHGSAIAGAVLVPCNTAWSDREVEHALQLTRPRVVFVGSDNRGVDLRPRADALADLVGGCTVIDLASLEARPSTTATSSLRRPALDDAFLVQFTSGTTGLAKGAVLSHRAALNAGYVRALTFDADEHDVWLNPAPLHHVGGSVVIVLAALSTGGAYVVMSRFDPVVQVALMRTTGATRTGGVPTMFHGLLTTPGIDEVLAQVASVGLGGASVPPSLIEELQGRGATVSVAYAQSECPMVTQSDHDGDAHHVATTVGLAVPHTELRIVDATGTTVARGEVGEVCVRSPLAMSGYWNMPEATAAAFDADGFLHTGDLGSIDDHDVVRIHGRSRELIIRGGENIYPIEVEDVLLRHPAVDAVAVLGRPSERWGEEVAAVVKLVEGGAATGDELAAHAAASIAHFKVPQLWCFVDEMPMTASGKIRKVELLKLVTKAES